MNTRFIVLALTASMSASALAQTRRGDAAPAVSSAPPAQANTTINGQRVTFALGYKSVGLDGTGGVHGRVMVTDRFAIGLLFGFTGNFNAIMVGPDASYEFIKMGDHAFFGEFGTGFWKSAAGNKIYFNALYGFRMRLFQRLDASLAYGLHAAFINLNQVALTATPLGNAAIHWTF